MDISPANTMISPFSPVIPTADSVWLIEESGFNLAREHEIESLFAIANGYVGSRGSLAEGSALSDPATFIAGVYDTGAAGTVPELAAAPDWMRLELRMDGEEFRLDWAGPVFHRRVLDLRQGILWRDFACRPPRGGQIRFCGGRLASLADRHVLLQSIRLIPEDHEAHLELRIVTEPVMEHPGRVRLHPGECLPLFEAGSDAHAIELCTRKTHIRVGVATAGRLLIDGIAQPACTEQSADRMVESWRFPIESGRDYRLLRVVTIFTSRDGPQPIREASRHLHRLLQEDFSHLVTDHTDAWARRWQTADVEIEGDPDAQRIIRFAAYHLIAAANPEDENASIGARALTGGAYKGHVFWDTEIFMLPFYLFTDPPAARALLMYRYHTLPAARDKARRLGYPGALYAWESTDTGEETTPPHALAPDGRLIRILNGLQEQHIGADVAYAVQQYWLATGDEDFMRQAGTEILLETARFWAGRGRVEADGRFHIRAVIGPDEYHEGVDDNAYTNLLAQWNLECAADAAAWLAARWPTTWRELARRLEVGDGEIEQWRERAERMYSGFDGEKRIYGQFGGYFGLEDLDIRQYAAQAGPIDILLGRERIQQSQVLKQADTVMLIYLLWDRFDPDVRAAVFRYYEPRTAHGSSLSPAIHAAVAARLGDMDKAMAYFRQAAGIDFADNMGNASGGVHAAALGGLWQAIVCGFAGMRLLPDGLAFHPHCPAEWPRVRFSVLWRGSHLRVEMGPEFIQIASGGDPAVPIRMGDAASVLLSPGQSKRWAASGGNWREVAP